MIADVRLVRTIEALSQVREPKQCSQPSVALEDDPLSILLNHDQRLGAEGAVTSDRFRNDDRLSTWRETNSSSPSSVRGLADRGGAVDCQGGG